MNVCRIMGLARPLCLLLLLSACGPDDPPPAGDSGTGEAAPFTNRLEVPPEVVNNLGITFAIATRGRLGVWQAVSGELEVPKHRRWIVRAPVAARIVSVVPKWSVVKAGEEVATLASPDIEIAQQAIESAERTADRTTAEVASARARLVDSEAHLLEARSFEQASRKRLADLQALGAQGNALTAREVLDAKSVVTAAGKASLDAAIARDQLISLAALRQQEADQAHSAALAGVGALALIAGASSRTLLEVDDQGPAWRQLRTLAQRAPAAGTVVELHVANGEFVEAGAPIAEVYDMSALHFHGHIPEGDLGKWTAGLPVRIEFPSKDQRPIETKLQALLPVADSRTRMIQVVADVANPDGALPHGISATAQVRVKESQNEEVMIPERCVVFDGLEAIVFKRDPADPNVVVRTLVELGARSAGQVEVFAGVLDGDSVVADGVRQLKQTGLGKSPEGGHFHADGTWHKEHE